jgi:radial spoke head protein 4A
LAQKFEPRNVHLWGKIQGSVKDYYVAEGEKEGGVEVPPEVESRGTGVNKNVYWITNSVTDEWIELPDTIPSTINLARQVKLIFTGKPETNIITNPHFAGKEKELLRAQIARITQMTSIIPKGYFKKQEDVEREIVEVPEEEKKALEFEELKELDNWCHLVPNILKVISNQTISVAEQLIYNLNHLKKNHQTMIPQ